MRIFVYELVTGGGWPFSEPPTASLLAEATAMVRALSEDFARIEGVEAFVLSDSRWPLRPIAGVHSARSETNAPDNHLSEVIQVAQRCTATVVIAPEFDDVASRYVNALERRGIRLLSPSGDFVATASDKLTANRLLEARVQVPRTMQLCVGKPLEPPFPLVAKPRYGCGSIGVQLLRSPNDSVDRAGLRSDPDQWLLQEFVPGIQASIAAFCGPQGAFPLAVCTQRLSDDGRFAYLGGEGPLPQQLGERAQHLARRALAVLPAGVGYVGFDIILGEADDGSQDYLIEVNPRLTTSYLGLRALSETNLAQAMFDAAEGRQPKLAWKPGRVRWSAEGAVESIDA
jgi:predicted ATP-grasp superfamily ATP-dependent carboligase